MVATILCTGYNTIQDEMVGIRGGVRLAWCDLMTSEMMAISICSEDMVTMVAWCSIDALIKSLTHMCVCLI